MAPDTKKPSHRLPPAEGTVPTPLRSTNMNTVLAPPDWRELVDTRDVLDVVRSVARTIGDPVLRDEAESALTMRAVTLAQHYVETVDFSEICDVKRHWFKFLWTNLRRYGSGVVRQAVYGQGPKAEFAAKVSHIADLEAADPGRYEGRVAPLCAAAFPSSQDADRVARIIRTREQVSVADVQAELGLTAKRASNLLSEGVQRGDYRRIGVGLYASHYAALKVVAA